MRSSYPLHSEAGSVNPAFLHGFPGPKAKGSRAGRHRERDRCSIASQSYRTAQVGFPGRNWVPRTYRDLVQPPPDCSAPGRSARAHSILYFPSDTPSRIEGLDFADSYFVSLDPSLGASFTKRATIDRRLHGKPILRIMIAPRSSGILIIVKRNNS